MLFERMYNAINKNIFIYFKHPHQFGLPASEDKQKKQMDIQKGIFTFIKLLCENHHENLQNFVTLVSPPNGPSMDMTKLLVKYLEILIKSIKRIIDDCSGKIKPIATEMEIHYKRIKLFYSHSSAIIKALCETVQGPCVKNQNAISETNFFAIAKDILNINGVKNRTNRIDEQQEKEIISDFEICILKTDCAILLLSLMEQQDENSTIVAKMKQTIDDNDLLINIFQIYNAFKSQSDGNYTEELLFEVRILLIYIYKNYFLKK